MTRQEYVNYLEILSRPMLEAAAKDKLKETMALDQTADSDREKFTYWEGLCRLLCGMAPWFEVEEMDTKEKALQLELLGYAHKAIEHHTNRVSADGVDFEGLAFDGSQIIVDTAFLAQGFLRSPKALWGGLSETGKKQTMAVLKKVRLLKPWNNNWMLFTTEIETILAVLGEEYHSGAVQHAYTTFERWFVGDGWYSDGEGFSLDFYNSLVIHPMLLDMGKQFTKELPTGWYNTYLFRAKRYCQHLERMIGPNGQYYATGRSLAYRCGAFHLLAQLALEENLPETVSYGAARRGLGLTIQATLSEKAYRADGFLNIGVSAEQPGLGEGYISTGSLYLCSTAFLPLGLPTDHAFWQEKEEPTSWEKMWAGNNLTSDISTH